MRTRWYSLIIVAVIGIVLGAGFKLFMTVNPFAPVLPQNESEVSVQQPIEPQETEVPESTTTETETTQEETKTSITPAKVSEGEIVVEGLVDSVSIKKYSLKFTQEMDDQSEKVNPRVQVLKDAVIELNGQPSEFDHIIVGDYVTMILDDQRKARAVQIER